MITLTTSGDSVVFNFDNNGHYLQEGTIEVPKNSLSLVIDTSDMVTFKKAASNDVFVSATLAELGMTKEQLIAFYEENMVAPQGGGGGGGTTPEEVQQMIDESISGLAESSAVTLEISEATSGKADADSLATVATSGSYDDLLDKPTIPTVPTSNTAFTNDAGYITSSALDGYATEQWVGEQGYITGVDLSNYATLQDIPDVSDYFDGAEYDSGTTRINFYHGNTVKAYIDASAFIVDGMIDDVRIETISGVTYLVIDFNTASGKEDIQIPLTDIFDPSNYYTKSEVDNAISGLNESIDTKLDASAYTPTDLSEYWTSAQTTSAIDAATSGKADTTAVTEAISAATDDMATKTWVGEQGYLTEHQSLSAYSTTEEVNSAIDEATSGKADTSAVTAVNDVLTTHTADTTIHVTSADKTAWNAKSDFSGSYNDLTDKPTIPTVPTSNTAFTNDAGYITSDAISGKADTSAVTESINAAVSGKVDTSTFDTYSGSVETALSGKQDTLIAGDNITISGNVISAEGGSITIDPSLDSGSTNAVANSAITDAVTANAYPIEGALTPKHFWNDENMGYYTEIDSSSSIKVANSTLLNSPYIAYVFSYDSEFMGGGCGYLATVSNGSITSIDLLNGSSISSLTVTYDANYTYFTPSGNTFSGDGIGVIAVMGMDYQPSSFFDLQMRVRQEATNAGIISVIGNIPSERIKQSVNRIYDAFNGFNNFNPIADTVTLDDGDGGTGRNDDGIGYGVINYNTYNPLTDTVTSGNTSDIFKYSAIDFKSNDNVLTYNGSAISMDSLNGRGAVATISAFTDGSSTTTDQWNSLFNYSTCFIVNTNSASSGGRNQELSIDISGPNNKSGNIQLRLNDRNGLTVQVSYNEKYNYVSKTINPFVLGNSYIIDTRKVGWGDEVGIHTLTVSNWQGSDFISSIKFYSTNNATIPIADIAADVAAGTYATTTEMFDELSHVAKEEEVNFYDYGSPSAVTIVNSAVIYDFYGIVISGMSSEFYINVQTDDASGKFVDGLSFNNDGSIESSQFPYEPIPYYLDDEITKFENGVWNIYFAEGTKADYLSIITTTEASAVIYKSFTETPIKDAVSNIQNSLSGYVATSAITSAVTSASTDSEIPTAKAVYDAVGQGGGGSSYSAGTGIDITNDVISVTGKVDTSTFNTYSGSVETALSGKQDTLIAGTNITISGNVISASGGGGSITIDPSLDSGSTNAVANSAITSAITADEYNAYECEIVRNGNSWKVADYDNIRYTYDATDSYGPDVYFRFTNGVIPSHQDFKQEIWRASLDENAIWNGGDIITAVTFIKSDVSSALTATFTGNHIVFKSNDIFRSKGLVSLTIYYGYGEPSDYNATNWEGFNNSVDNEDIFIDEYNTAHTIPSESIKSRVDRLFDMIDSVKDYKAEIKNINFTDGKAIGRMISWNPITQKHCSEQSHKLFNYNPRDFSSNENGFSFTKTILDSNLLPYIDAKAVIDDLNDGTQYNVSDFGGSDGALLIETDSTYQNQWGDFSLRMQADRINFGEMRFMWQDGRLEVNIMADVIGEERADYREEFENVTLGDKLTVDLRYALPGITNLTLTVQNQDIPSFIKKINIYHFVRDAVVTFDEWQNGINKTLEELDAKEEAITKALYELKGRIETLENNNN